MVPLVGDCGVMAMVNERRRAGGVPMKHRAITLERVEKFTSPIYPSSVAPNLARIREATCDGGAGVALRAVAVAGRPPFSDARAHFPRMAPIAVGHAFGPTWSSHWVEASIAVPGDWLATGRPVQLMWNAECEALVHDEAGRAVQGVNGGDGGDKRHAVLLPRGAARVTLFLEVSCNTMFGAGHGGMIQAPSPDRHFTLQVRAWRYAFPCAGLMHIRMPA